MKKLIKSLCFLRGSRSKILQKIKLPVLLIFSVLFVSAEDLYYGSGGENKSVDLPSGTAGFTMEYQTVQQQNVIKGKVIDEEGAPLPGVTITIVGTTRGVITDVDGTYSIEAKPVDKLVFSFIGKESQIIDVGNQSTINVTLGEKIDD